MKVKDSISDEELLKKIESVSWWHPFIFRNYKVKSIRIRRLGVLNSYKDLSVLDIGCLDGFYGFDAEERGAKRVLMIDKYTTEGNKMAFELLDTKVEYRNMDLYDLDKIDEKFDVTLFMGVLYHLHSPFLGLQRVSEKTKKLMILESKFTGDKEDPIPILKFWKEVIPDSYWIPSVSCIKEMMEVVGFKRFEEKYIKGIGQDDRIMFYAWK